MFMPWFRLVASCDIYKHHHLYWKIFEIIGKYRTPASKLAFSQFHRNKYQLGFSLVNCVLSWMLNLRGFHWTVLRMAIQASTRSHLQWARTWTRPCQKPLLQFTERWPMAYGQRVSTCMHSAIWSCTWALWLAAGIFNQLIHIDLPVEHFINEFMIPGVCKPITWNGTRW